MEIKFDTKELIKIANRYDLKFVILHGSQAAGQARPESDIDIAVVGNHQLSFDETARLYGELAVVFEDGAARELDLKTLQNADPFFRHEVTRVGRLLYGDNVAYEEFKASTNRAYDDAGPLFDLEGILARRYQRHLNTVAAQYA